MPQSTACIVLCKIPLLLVLLIYTCLLVVFEGVAVALLPFSRPLSEKLLHIYSVYFVRLFLAVVRVGNKRLILFYTPDGKLIDSTKKYRKTSKSYLIESNHICALDTIITGYIGRDILGTNTKFMSKNQVKYFPVIGWALNLAGYLFIRRSWKEDVKKISEWCSKIKHREHQSFVIYSEGTRFSERRKLESVRYSMEYGKPVLKNLLYPRVKGFKLCAESLSSSVFATVLHVTIVYTRGGKRAHPPGFFSSLLVPVKGTFSVFIEFSPISDIKDPETYLIRKYVEKDKTIARFISSRSNPEGICRRSSCGS